MNDERTSSPQSCPAPKQTPVNKMLQLLIDSHILSKSVWKFWYSFAARVDGRAGHLKFMNFGYAPDGGSSAVLNLDPADEPNRNTIQLYYHAVGRKSLEGQDVLEVGCGRGGGAYSLMKYARPRTLTGMDLSPHAVRLARESYSLPGLAFRRGDAENLPFPDGSFHAVVNVESSHCYPAFRRFLAEVSRVLKPGGKFYYADFRRIHEMADWERDIEESGFHLREKEDITPDVVRALTQDSPKKEGLIARRIARFLHPAFKKFACTVGSENYQSFIEGRRFYRRYLLVKG
ncbi:MAG: class I SAM-dependent methyltransferase [Candidatus Aminicenantes bacterium]|nr:class I SAM-dependent methyltransferase [Candidatus Aminicenantes bacterium]